MITIFILPDVLGKYDHFYLLYSNELYITKE